MDLIFGEFLSKLENGEIVISNENLNKEPVPGKLDLKQFLKMTEFQNKQQVGPFCEFCGYSYQEKQLWYTNNLKFITCDDCHVRFHGEIPLFQEFILEE